MAKLIKITAVFYGWVDDADAILSADEDGEASRKSAENIVGSNADAMELTVQEVPPNDYRKLPVEPEDWTFDDDAPADVRRS